MNEKGERLMFGLFHKKEQKALELGAPVSHVRRGDSRKRRGGKTHGWQDLRAGGWGDYLVI